MKKWTYSIKKFLKVIFEYIKNVPTQLMTSYTPIARSTRLTKQSTLQGVRITIVAVGGKSTFSLYPHYSLKDAIFRENNIIELNSVCFILFYLKFLFGTFFHSNKNSARYVNKFT